MAHFQVVVAQSGLAHLQVVAGTLIALLLRDGVPWPEEEEEAGTDLARKGLRQSGLVPKTRLCLRKGEQEPGLWVAQSHLQQEPGQGLIWQWWRAGKVSQGRPEC